MIDATRYQELCDRTDERKQGAMTTQHSWSFAMVMRTDLRLTMVGVFRPDESFLRALTKCMGALLEAQIKRRKRVSIRRARYSCGFLAACCVFRIRLETVQLAFVFVLDGSRQTRGVKA